MNTNVDLLAIDQLRVDRAYQRTVKRHVVRKITGNFDWSAFGTLLVGRRKDKSLWVVDGQQRLESAKKLNISNVPCSLFDSKGSSHEAELFRRVNGDRQNVSRNELFKAALEAGDIQSMDILGITERQGFVLQFNGGSHSNPTCIRQAAPLEAVYEMEYPAGGGELLETVLRVIYDAWNDIPGATRSFVITGVGRFFSRYPNADPRRVAKCLRKLSPDHLLRFTDDSKQLLGGSRDSAVAKVIQVQYDKRLTENRLVKESTS